MRVLVFIVFIKLLPAQAQEVDALALAAERCHRFTEVKSSSPSKVQSVIEENKKSKQEACAEMKAFMAERKKVQDALKQLIEQNSLNDFLTSTDTLHSNVEEETLRLISATSELKKTTGEISDQSNLIFKNLKSCLDDAKWKLTEWSRHWSETHKVPNGSTLQQLLDLSQNQYLNKTTKIGLTNYLSRLPSYIVQKSSPPREPLLRLQQAINASHEAMNIRNRAYTLSFRKSMDEKIDTALDPILLRKMAKTYFLKARLSGTPRDPIVASTEYLIEGACYSAVSEIQNALDWISAIKASAPLQFKSEIEVLAADDETRLRSRLKKLPVCSSPLQIALLKNAIAQRIKFKCEKTSPKIQRLLAEANVNWAAMNAISKQTAANYPIIYQLDTEKIWRDLKLAEDGCNSGILR